jgi:hypothetical protein
MSLQSFLISSMSLEITHFENCQVKVKADIIEQDVSNFRYRAVGFIFSRNGFAGEAEDYCREMGIACSEDEKWLGG